MKDDYTVGIPEETEEVILNSLETVIGVLEGFKDIFEGFASVQKCMLDMPEDELKAMFPPDVIDGVKALREDQVEGQLLQPARDIERAIEVLNQLKSPDNIQLFRVASSEFVVAISRVTSGLDKLRRFLEGKSIL